MCDHQPREPAMPVVADGVWCDPCLAPLVKALNDGGLTTAASCCGHGESLGSITLDDGRWLVIVPDEKALHGLVNEPTLIAGADAPPQRCQQMSATPWGPAQCALVHGHTERHAYSPSESEEATDG